MGVLRKITDEEIFAMLRLHQDNDFLVLRKILEDSLGILREKSDQVLDRTFTHKQEYVSKGQRQALAELLFLSSEEEIRSISDKVRARRQNETRPVQ